MSSRKWLVTIGTVAIAQVLLLGLYQRFERSRKGEGLGVQIERRSETARDISVELPDGALRIIPARSPQFQLVHFWATWCPPCRKELPLLVELARRHPDRLRVWSISTDPGWASVREFFGGEIPVTVVRDPNGSACRSYRVTALPDTYLVDPEGKIVARFVGGQDWGSRDLEKTLERLVDRTID